MSATGNRGFTLFELLVVLAILVLLAGAWSFAAPRLFPAQQLRNETQRLIVTLRLARMTARIQGTRQRANLSLSPNPGTATIVSYGTSESADVRAEDGISTDERSLTFYPDGSSTGSLLEIGVAGRTATVRVGPVTGRAEIVE
jgi:prepilin-type N-terminal cleavage/methylation domain-containing protein